MDHGTSKRSGFLRIYNFHTGECELGAVWGGAIQKCKVMLKLNVLERERERVGHIASPFCLCNIN